MINKLAKAHKSWITKLILSLTAFSFMSLFGITEYISKAGNNRTVIKVDDIEISQAQFNHKAQRELSAIKRMLPEDQDISEEMQTALLSDQIQKMVRNAVLDRTAEKYHIAFRPEMIRSMILNQPSFRDASGNFSKELYHRTLSESGLTEADLVNDIKRDLTQRLMVNLPVSGIKVPEPLIEAMGKVDNKRRTFKYVVINPENVEINRKISQEEIEQYYEDFQMNFMDPERRNATVLYLPANMKDVAGKLVVSDEEIQAYYDDHRSDYEIPEKRNVQQMLFSDQEQAEAAYQVLKAGKDFYEVANEFAGQKNEDTDFGFVAEDELIPELAAEVFALSENQFSAPVQTEEGWQILKVSSIQAASKTPYATAAAEIRDILLEDMYYPFLDKLYAEIEDKLAAGETLENVAQQTGASVAAFKGIGEDGSVIFATPQLKWLVENSDFLDAVFSYTLNETSGVVQTDEGFAVVRIEEIVPTHPKDIAEVQSEIQNLWAQNEKTAIAQELINDMTHDLENGDDLSQTARRYNLEVYKSQPITRNETFAGIGFADIRKMFGQPIKTIQQVQQGDQYIIAVAENEYKNSTPLTQQEENIIRFTATQSLLHDFSEAMLNSYAEDYKIRIKYKLMGIED